MSKLESISIPKKTDAVDTIRAQYAAAGRMGLAQLTLVEPAPSTAALSTSDLTGLGHFAARA